MISNIPFWLSVTFKDQPHSWAESFLETTDNYFYLGGKKACAVGPLLCGSRRTEIEVRSSSYLSTALKVISYFTLVLPLIVLIAKLILRTIYHFHIETEVNKRTNDFIPLKAGVWKALPNDIKGNILPFLSAKAALTIYPRLEKKTSDVLKKFHSQVIAAYLTEKSADKSLEKLSKDLYLKLIQEAGSNLKKLDLSSYDKRCDHMTGPGTTEGVHNHYQDDYLLKASTFCHTIEELILKPCTFGELSLNTFLSIPTFESLKFLDLVARDLTNANLDAIAEKYPHLQGLTLSFVREANAVDSIKKFSNLTYLNIPKMVPPQVYIDHPSCSKIKKMNIHLWKIQPGELSQLFLNYINLEELELSLNIDYPYVPDYNPPNLTDLSHLKKLRKLKLNTAKLDLKYLIEGLPSLEYLDLSFSTISQFSDVTIDNHPSHKALEYLQLNHTTITLLHLTTLICCYPNLRELYLRNCQSNDRFLETLATHCTKLKVLDISSSTSFTMSGLKLITDKLPNLKIVK